ncbi:hypothetical protein AMTR_s00127p00030460 [Amborella trichopoda]|uniref:Uncharacterized protein n=1 Tax=Amborella trichopoda TaxID=13333 RepID=W1NNQ6_AMBTC|nr:hypothetical protein AMTR_s00127p00030460 [Amborella trichopoda]
MISKLRFATVLRGVSFKKETFDHFKGLLTNLEHWRVEALQREYEVQKLCGARLTSLEDSLAQHQNLMIDYNEKKISLLSYQDSFKKKDTTYLTKIKDVEEEMAKLQAYLNRLKS